MSCKIYLYILKLNNLYLRSNYYMSIYVFTVLLNKDFKNRGEIRGIGIRCRRRLRAVSKGTTAIDRLDLDFGLSC